MRHFITAKMHRRQRYARFLIHGCEFPNHFLHKAVGRRQSDVYHIVCVVLDGLIAGGVFRLAQQIFGGLCHVRLLVFIITRLHGDDSRTRMSGRFYLRYDTNMPFGGIAQQADEVLAGIMPVSNGGSIRIASAVVAWIEAPAFVNGMSATASHRGQLLQTGNVQTPRFVIGKMEVQHVHFVGSENVYQFFKVVYGGEITGNVYHLSAIQEVGVIFHRHSFQPVRHRLAFQY